MKIIRNNIVPFRGFGTMTLWPFVFVRHDARFTATTERDEDYLQNRRRFAWFHYLKPET